MTNWNRKNRIQTAQMIRTQPRIQFHHHLHLLDPAKNVLAKFAKFFNDENQASNKSLRGILNFNREQNWLAFLNYGKNYPIFYVISVAWYQYRHIISELCITRGLKLNEYLIATAD